MIVSGPADVRAAFDDPLFEVPTAPPATVGVGWLRATVSRFANGEVHARRRTLVEEELEVLKLGDLRSLAASLAGSFDARDVPLAALCTCFGSNPLRSSERSRTDVPSQPPTRWTATSRTRPTLQLGGSSRCSDPQPTRRPRRGSACSPRPAPRQACSSRAHWRSSGPARHERSSRS
ncbi:MAG: hypothetical protein E6G12_03365, partial [Actinobacteria bacterium]